MSSGGVYQQVVLEHNRNPRNYGEVACPCCQAQGRNPLCGDAITITARLEEDAVVEIKFQGVGCAVFRASASLMTVAVQGLKVAEVLELARRAREGLSKEEGELPVGLDALAGVRYTPARVKCALLAWETLIKMLMESSRAGIPRDSHSA